MKLKDLKFYITVLIAIVIWFFLTCEFDSGVKKSSSLLNISHLQHLSEEWVSGTDSMRFVHIYAEYPSYHWVEDSDEGMACVDDASRAAIFYLQNYEFTKNPSSLQYAEQLLNFILYMQAPNGLFYNFIFSDHTINKSHKNSISRASWWSWRSIWALAEAYEKFKPIYPEYAQSLAISIERTFPAIDSLLQSYPQIHMDNGLKLPTWLPYRMAADQAAVMILALVPYYRTTMNQNVREYIRKLADGILTMQVGDSLNIPYGCFLSWKNVWHAYGNSQSYALLLSGETLENNDYIESALLEIKYFYPFLMQRQFLAAFSVTRVESEYRIKNEKQFSQIAYDIRPMVWASLKAFEITGDSSYAKQAGELSSWFFGNNITGKSLYDPNSGRCYDGINNQDTINKNSGAESTIEALLTIQAVEQNRISRDMVRIFYKKSKHSDRNETYK